MSDNARYTEGTGIYIATDDASGIHFQKIKIDGGADGQTTMITGTTEYGITADIKRLPNGSTMLGNVNVERISGFISAGNSSTATLLANAKFTGTAEEVLHCAEIQIGVFASHRSQNPGLSGQFSTDGTNWDYTQAFYVDISATSVTPSIIILQPKLKFFRLVYQNGGTNQTFFRLQTVYKTIPTQPPTNGGINYIRRTQAAQTSVVTLIDENNGRRGAWIHNDGNSRLFLALGADASQTSFTFVVGPNETRILPESWTGAVTGLWNLAIGTARITEIY